MRVSEGAYRKAILPGDGKVRGIVRFLAEIRWQMLTNRLRFRAFCRVTVRNAIR
jgi:hypothetical protein